MDESTTEKMVSLDKNLESNQKSQLDGFWSSLLKVNDTKESPEWTVEQEENK